MIRGVGKDFQRILKEAMGGDMQSFARLLTLIERAGPSVLKQKELLEPERAAFRVGITGPPGAGKSTLIDQMLSEVTKVKNLKVGVLAVDPSSPFSQGAILGDRIRYSNHFLNPQIFIRSLGTRGSLGGLSASAYLMLRAFDACGFDLVFIETVGVGQAEVEIVHVADLITLVLVPESGDSVQAMKAGVLEIADLFVINKSDRPGAESLKKEIEAQVALGGEEEPPCVEMISALSGQGVMPLVQTIMDMKKKINPLKNRGLPVRLREEARSLMRSKLEEKALRSVSRIKSPKDLRAVLKNA